MKRSWKYQSKDGKEVWKELEKIIAFGYSAGDVFNDWLDIILYSLLSLTESGKKIFEKKICGKAIDEYEKKYLEIVKKYNNDAQKGERPIDYFSNAWVLLMKETEEKRKDIIGQIYQDRITYGEGGQFFTPEHIIEAMVAMVNPKKKEKVNDPCCGSGRMLISSFKKNKDVELFGTDLDKRCAKMAAINMWMFNCNALIKWGNSLSNETYQIWKILKGGFILTNQLK